MPDPSVRKDGPGNDLDFQAFLYASGELGRVEALGFERRLGEEQAARDALCQAVQLCLTLGGAAGAMPDRAYRESVRQRLRSRPGMAQVPGQPCADRGHPVIWGALGAAGAVLLMFALERPQSPALPDGGQGSPVARASPSSTVPDGLDDPPPAPPTDMASVWAELPNGEHLRTARDEQMRRKVRAEDFHRLAAPHERRPRVLANPAPNHSLKRSPCAKNALR